MALNAFASLMLHYSAAMNRRRCHFPELAPGWPSEGRVFTSPKIFQLVLGLFIVCSGRAAGASPAERPPNVVIFIADDLTWHDVACFGGPTDARTPHLDQLAREGMKLTGFYSPAAVCSPLRQALLTGMYPVRNGAYPNHAKVRDGVRSLPHQLRPLGYRTACLGKTHFDPPASYPFDVLEITRPAESSTPAAANKSGATVEIDDGDFDFGALERFIRTDPQRPFCAYIATHEPHAPWNKGDQSAFDPAKLKVPPYHVDTPETRQDLAAYYAEVALLDHEVGSVMATLEKTGQTANTLFLFVSEQGSGVPHAKWSLYNPGIRVAAIARWPGKIKPGSENAALMQYVDVLPTLIAAAGGDPTKADTGCPDTTGYRGFDGRSFLDVLRGKTNKLRDVVFAQHTTRGIKDGSEAYASRAACDGRWKLIVNLHAESTFNNLLVNAPVLQSWRRKGQQGDAFAAEQAARYTKRPALELYDLQADPWELTNVADRPENAATLGRLRAQLDAWMRQQGDLGDQTEREATEHQAGKRSTAKPKK